MKTAIEKRMMNYQTDSFGIVHHARYLEIMEEARWLYCYENNLMEAFHQKGIFRVMVNKSASSFLDITIVSTLQRVNVFALINHSH